MKTIQLNNDARDVEHDASVEVPDDTRSVLVSREGYPNCWWGLAHYHEPSGWPIVGVVTWRELPAPPKPSPKIVEYSTKHWHDPKVERPEGGKRFVIMYHSGMMSGSTLVGVLDWDVVLSWTYAPETSR